MKQEFCCPKCERLDYCFSLKGLTLKLESHDPKGFNEWRAAYERWIDFML